MNANSRRWLVVGIVLLTAVFLVAGTLLISGWFFSGWSRMGWGMGSRGRLPFRTYTSNGERIYFTGQSETGPQITSQMQGMHRMQAGRMACVDCHGSDGRGGTVRMMMSSFDAPDIRYSTLIEGEHEDAHGEHPPYLNEDIKRAITEGIDPAGEELDWIMPRWEMTDEQLNDVIAYMKTLE
jgi:cytochrome c oxidase subunit II